MYIFRFILLFLAIVALSNIFWCVTIKEYLPQKKVYGFQFPTNWIFISDWAAIFIWLFIFLTAPYNLIYRRMLNNPSCLVNLISIVSNSCGVSNNMLIAQSKQLEYRRSGKLSGALFWKERERGDTPFWKQEPEWECRYIFLAGEGAGAPLLRRGAVPTSAIMWKVYNGLLGYVWSIRFCGCSLMCAGTSWRCEVSRYTGQYT